jgi:hypothetical protein
LSRERDPGDDRRCERGRNENAEQRALHVTPSFRRLRYSALLRSAA